MDFCRIFVDKAADYGTATGAVKLSIGVKGQMPSKSNKIVNLDVVS